MTSKIEQFFDELEDQLLKAINPEKVDGETPTDTAPEAPEAPKSEVDELSVEGLALEAIRVLKKAENTDYVDEAESLLHIADRYVRLTELAIHANSVL